MNNALLDDKAALFERLAEALVNRRLLRVGPHDQKPLGIKEIDKPVQVASRALSVRQRQSTSATSYCSAARPQLPLDALRR
jgi:hypothetical protein